MEKLAGCSVPNGLRITINGEDSEASCLSSSASSLKRGRDSEDDEEEDEEAEDLLDTGKGTCIWVLLNLINC